MLRYIILLLLWANVGLMAQDSVAYTPGFPLRPGIYLSYEQFRSNHPVPRKDVIFQEDSTRLDFLKLALGRNTVEYRDSSGKITEVKTSALWGYCENNTIYIRYNGLFNRVMVVGTLCHFTSYVTEYMYTSPGNYPVGTYGTPVETMQQYFLDTQTGRILIFNQGNMEYILQRDPALYQEFSSLRKREKRDMIFLYLRKYNEKHPLKFPSSSGR